MAMRLTGILTLLKRHGRNVKITYDNVSNEYDPVTGTVVKYEIPSQVVRGYFYDTRNQDQFDTQVDEGSRRCVIFPLNIDSMPIRKPRPGDKLDGQRDSVVIWRVEEILSNERILAYICRVKE